MKEFLKEDSKESEKIDIEKVAPSFAEWMEQKKKELEKDPRGMDKFKFFIEMEIRAGGKLIDDFLATLREEYPPGKPEETLTFSEWIESVKPLPSAFKRSLQEALQQYLYGLVGKKPPKKEQEK